MKIIFLKFYYYILVRDGLREFDMMWLVMFYWVVLGLNCMGNDRKYKVFIKIMFLRLNEKLCWFNIEVFRSYISF